MIRKLLPKSIKNFIKTIRTFYYGYGYRHFGYGSIIKSPLRIIGKKFISVGARCYIQAGLRLEAVSLWGGHKYAPNVIIQNNVVVGQNCHFTCASRLFIGEGTSILPQVLITDIEHLYVPGKSLDETGLEVGSVTIGKNVTIGMGARILGHRNISIGDNAVIGANAVICQDVPSNMMVAGIPAKAIKRYDYEQHSWIKI